jgi:hypothetical protein
MKSFQVLFFIGVTVFSCTTDNQAVDNFNNCITTQQQIALKELTNVCDTFIKYNYPDMDTEEAYRQFLKDLETEKDNWKTSDSVSVMNVNRTLEMAFGDGYDEETAVFNPSSTVTNCLEKTSNSRFVDDFVKASMSSGGGDGPNMVGWRIINNKVDPLSGQVKVIYLTEVVYRTLYFRTTK